MFFIFIENAMICLLFSLIFFFKNLCLFMFITIIVIVVIYSFVQIMFTTWPHVANKKEWCCKACSPNVAKKWTKLQSMCTKCCKKWTKLQSMFTKCCKNMEQCCNSWLPNVAKHWEQCCKTCLPNVAKHLEQEQCCKACLPNVAKHWEQCQMLQNI